MDFPERVDCVIDGTGMLGSADVTPLTISIENSLNFKWSLDIFPVFFQTSLVFS